jgi:periplasmic copper chaperone A
MSALVQNGRIMLKSIAIKSIAAFAVFMPASGLIYAQNVKVEGAWVRVAVQGQSGTGGFMRLTADQDMKLVGAASPAAGVAEVHEMKMEGDVMKMRPIDSLDLPAGKTVELKSGGHHIMLMDLKQALPNNSSVPLTLLFKDKAGKDVKLELKVPVSTRGPGAVASGTDNAPHADHHK